MPVSNFPDIEPNNIEINSIDNTVVTRAVSGRELRTQVGTQRYEFIFEYENLTEDQRKQILGHFALARGQLNEFYINLPTGIKDSTGTEIGTVTVRSPVPSAGQLSCPYTSSITSGTVFKAGDLIQFSNHGKLYEVTADSTATTQIGTVNFSPPLLDNTLTTSDTINHKNLTALVRYSDDIRYEVRNNLYSNIGIRFIEVIE